MSAPYNQTIAECGSPMARRRHARKNETCETCGPLKHRAPLAPCGTKQARDRHRRREETCEECNMLKTYTQKLAPCGTSTARRRHRKRNEQCSVCDAAKKRHDVAVCGTDSARKRHRRLGETCEACKPAPRKVQPCGTPAAWRRHRRNNETPCQPCTDAIHAHDQGRKKRPNKGIYTMGTQPTSAELIQEILFLLNAGEGEARILAATGYTGRAPSLRSRLSRERRNDLAARIFTPWELAA